MIEPRFTGPGAWAAAVDRVLARPGVRRDLVAKGIDPETLLAVAEVEASRADPDGISTLSHEGLAELTGVSRTSVRRLRLALVELGMETLAAAPGATGEVYRVLHDV